MSARFTRLLIPRSLLDALLAHARAELPNECCGLLGGVEGRVTRHFPICNDAASPTEYFTNARDLLDAMKILRFEGIEVLAFYHSHPSSEPVPSKTDIERNTWGETVIHVIVGLAGNEPEVRAWWIGETEVREVEIHVHPSRDR
jgi:proteasome lid subunit RPN8/RPN11